MKTSRMKKIISMFLVIAMVLPMSISAFAADTDQKASNRYYWESETIERHLVYTHVKTWEDLQDEADYEDAVDHFIDIITPDLSIEYVPEPSDVLKVFMDMLNDMHGIGSKGKVETYSRVDILYRVDSITHNKTRVGYDYVLEYVIYVDNGDGYEWINTREWHSRNK